jgi:hypothetical protein
VLHSQEAGLFVRNRYVPALRTYVRRTDTLHKWFLPQWCRVLEDKCLWLKEIHKVCGLWRINCHNTSVIDIQTKLWRKTMKTLLGCLLLVLTTFAHAAAPSRKVWTGSPQFTESRTLHIGGATVTVVLIEMRYHQMGCMVSCSDGPVLSFWMQSGPNQDNCSRWYSNVVTLEAQLAGSDSNSFLELDTVGSQVSMEEGIRVYPASAVSCHGVLDWAQVSAK